VTANCLAPGGATLTMTTSTISGNSGQLLTTVLVDSGSSASLQAVTIADNFVASYADCEDLSVTQSVCDLDKCDLLASAIDRLAETLLRKLVDVEAKRSVMLARLQVQTYEHTEYIDLYDFCALLREHSRDDEIRTASSDVMEVISSKGFVVKSLYQGDAMQYSYGLSIYFPLLEVSRSYERLDIARDTRWVTFLKEYLRKIRRPNRASQTTD